MRLFTKKNKSQYKARNSTSQNHVTISRDSQTVGQSLRDNALSRDLDIIYHSIVTAATVDDVRHF